MANYITIDGYIEDIYEGITGTGKQYVGIAFYTQDAHEHESKHEICWYFTTDSAIEMSQEKIERLREMADKPLPKNTKKPRTVEEGLKALAIEELAMLKIPVTVQVQEYKEQLRAQYDLGWKEIENGPSAFQKFSDIVEKRKKEIFGDIPEAETGSGSTVYEDDIPF